MKKLPECIPPMVRAGISQDDALAIRRIAITLHRWYELECGTDSGSVERDETSGKIIVRNRNGDIISRNGADRETPALKRLAAIMERYKESGLSYYLQTDPRGAPVYILRSGDVPEGADVSSYYPRGLAVYK